jgi:hypothetical protein
MAASSFSTPTIESQQIQPLQAISAKPFIKIAFFPDRHYGIYSDESPYKSEQ